MKKCEGVQVLDGEELLASGSTHFSPRQVAPNLLYTRWTWPHSRFKCCEEEKYLFLELETEAQPSTPSAHRCIH